VDGLEVLGVLPTGGHLSLARGVIPRLDMGGPCAAVEEGRVSTDRVWSQPPLSRRVAEGNQGRGWGSGRAGIPFARTHTS
jgi:hypothetical protein